MCPLASFPDHRKFPDHSIGKKLLFDKFQMPDVIICCIIQCVLTVTVFSTHFPHRNLKKIVIMKQISFSNLRLLNICVKRSSIVQISGSFKT